MASYKSSFQLLDVAQRTHNDAKRCLKEIREVAAFTVPIEDARRNPVYEGLFQNLDMTRARASRLQTEAITLFEEEQDQEKIRFAKRLEECKKWAISETEAGIVKSESDQ